MIQVTATALDAFRRPVPSERERRSGGTCRDFWHQEALSGDLRLDRPLTDLERLALAVASCEPTHHLTLNSPWSDQATFAHAWRLLYARIARGRKHRSSPLIYFACMAQGRNAGTYHGHFLLWDYVHAPVLHGHARDLGFGPSKINRITPEWGDRLNVVTYVLGQTEPVLGRSQAARHLPREKGVPRYLRPRDRTLASHAPKLSFALNAAQDHTLTDEKLYRLLSSFIGLNELMVNGLNWQSMLETISNPASYPAMAPMQSERRMAVVQGDGTMTGLVLSSLDRRGHSLIDEPLANTRGNTGTPQNLPQRRLPQSTGRRNRSEPGSGAHTKRSMQHHLKPASAP